MTDTDRLLVQSAGDTSGSDLLRVWSAMYGGDVALALDQLAEWMRLNTPQNAFVAQYVSPAASPATVDVSGGFTWVVATPAATIASMTVKLPPNPADGDEVIISTTQAFTALTVDKNGATSIFNAPTTLAAGASFRVKYDARLFSWFAGNTGVPPALNFQFTSRSEAQASTVPVGVNFISVGPLLYSRDASGTAMTTSGGVNWSPVGVATPEHWGAVGNGIANDTMPVQNAVAWGKGVTGSGTYRVSTGITVSAAQRLQMRLLWGGSADSTVMTLSVTGVDVASCVIDGNLLANTGIRDNTGLNNIHDCEIKNLWSSTNQVAGIFGTSQTGGSTYLRNKFSNLESVGDVTTGNANGASRAILMSYAGALTNGYVVAENDVSGIIGEEGDGIQILLFDGSVMHSSARTTIRNNIVRGCTKRCIKVQAADTVVSGNNLLLDVAGSYSALDIIDANRVDVTGNRVAVTAADGRGIQYSSFNVALDYAGGGNIVGNTVDMPSAGGIAIYGFKQNGIRVSGNTVRNGRIIVDESSGPVADDNVGYNIALSSSDGLVSIRVNCTGAVARGNMLMSGGVYTCVRNDAVGSFISSNRNLATTHASASVVFANVEGAIIVDNVNAKAAVPAVRYGGTGTDVNQALVRDNITLA